MSTLTVKNGKEDLDINQSNTCDLEMILMKETIQ